MDNNDYIIKTRLLITIMKILNISLNKNNIFKSFRPRADASIHRNDHGRYDTKLHSLNSTHANC